MKIRMLFLFLFSFVSVNSLHATDEYCVMSEEEFVGYIASDLLESIAEILPHARYSFTLTDGDFD